MAKKKHKHKPEEIVAKLRQANVLVSQGRPVAEAIRAIAISLYRMVVCDDRRQYRAFGGHKRPPIHRT
jgi:putative transposase